MSAKDGGPAFPAFSATVSTNGMSLRDYFAAAALTGLVTHAYYLPEDFPEGVVSDAYRVADAMLAERSRDANK